MAHRYNQYKETSAEAMKKYISLHTLAAGVGILYVLLSAVTFEMMSQPTILPGTEMAFTFSPEIAGWVALISLVAAFLASRTRDPSDYHFAEKAVVAVSFASVPAVHYVPMASDLLAQHPLIIGFAGVVGSLVAFVIVVR